MSVIPENEINVADLKRLTLIVRKGYRNVAYHNYEHAFNFMHAMFNVIIRNKDLFTSMEVT